MQDHTERLGSMGRVQEDDHLGHLLAARPLGSGQAEADLLSAGSGAGDHSGQAGQAGRSGAGDQAGRSAAIHSMTTAVADGGTDAAISNMSCWN